MDVAEGADIIMVKPALAYLDVIRAVSDEINMPIAAYNVSGEYAMIEAAAERGWIDRERRDGDAARDPARRRRHHHHVSRARGRPPAQVTSPRRHKGHEDVGLALWK